MPEKLLKPEVQQFIKDHEREDPFTLSLKYKEVGGVPIKFIAEQIAARQKAKVKLPEWYNTEKIIFPPLLSMEQCSSEQTARYKAELVAGDSLVDLTGGAGIDAFYFSKKFTEVHYIEQNQALTQITAHNFKVLNVDNIFCHHNTAEDFLSQSKIVDNFYIDPARRDDHARKVFRFEDCTPDVVELIPILIKKSRRVMIKASPMLDIDLAVRDLKYVEEIHVVSIDNECKEVLYLISDTLNDDPRITTINFRKNGDRELLTFLKSEETKAMANINLPQEFLYEPNSSVLKAGAFNMVAIRYNVDKLHQHTHLYTSKNYIDNFPGRGFKVIEVVPYSKKMVAALVPERKANIATRNFPDDVKTIRKKLNLKDGGDKYIFAFTDAGGNKKLAVTLKMTPQTIN